MTRFERLFSSVWGLAIIYVVFLGAYLGASDGRLRQHSAYNHFVYLADGWLHGRLDLASNPPNENDWARVEVSAPQGWPHAQGPISHRRPHRSFLSLAWPLR